MPTVAAACPVHVPYTWQGSVGEWRIVAPVDPPWIEVRFCGSCQVMTQY